MATLLFPSSANEAKKFSRLTRAGRMRRLYAGIYTDDFNQPAERVLTQNWLQVVANVAPNAILSHRTALKLELAYDENSNAVAFLTAPVGRNIKLPGLTLKCLPGDTERFTENVLPQLRRSNDARAFLENCATARQRSGLVKRLSESELEELLATKLQLGGEQALNELRDRARSIAQSLAMHEEFARLNDLIQTLLQTHSTPIFRSTFGTAVVRGLPYDKARLRMFEKLSVDLRRISFRSRPFAYAQAEWRSLSFFESYFSNYIEGTKFRIDEAEDIVFEGKAIINRHEDSHDVQGLFQIVSDLMDMSRTPESSDTFMQLLKERHALLMKERPAKRPGSFKQAANVAGNSVFVDPEKVVGTLSEGFNIYQTLDGGIRRALFMMFLVSEVHPFDDGNGRIARVMMNAELVRNSEFKCIIPPAHRENYLNGLRRATRDSDFHLFCRVMDQAWAYTESVPWEDYGAAREKLENDAAHLEPNEGLPRFNRALRPLQLSIIPPL